MTKHSFRTVALAMCIPLVIALAADNPFVGTWKVNPSKSKIPSNSGISSNATINIESEGDGLKVTVDSTDPQGQPLHFTYTASLDGKPGTATGTTTFDTITLQRVNDHTITAVGKKDGKTVFTDRRVVSKDGKTMTNSRDGTNPQGQKFHASLVSDKQ